jgi:hypothetical protein
MSTPYFLAKASVLKWRCLAPFYIHGEAGVGGGSDAGEAKDET